MPDQFRSPTVSSVNPDQAFILSFLAGDRAPARITTNPVAAALKAELRAATRDGSVTVAFEPSQQFLQGGQVIQGGILTVMLDFAMAFAAQACLPQNDGVATVNINVSMLKPAVAGRYDATGRVIRQGRTMIFANAELHNSGGATIAVSTGVMAVIRK